MFPTKFLTQVDRLTSRSHTVTLGQFLTPETALTSPVLSHVYAAKLVFGAKFESEDISKLADFLDSLPDSTCSGIVDKIFTAEVYGDFTPFQADTSAAGTNSAALTLRLLRYVKKFNLKAEQFRRQLVALTLAAAEAEGDFSAATVLETFLNTEVEVTDLVLLLDTLTKAGQSRLVFFLRRLQLFLLLGI